MFLAEPHTPELLLQATFLPRRSWSPPLVRLPPTAPGRSMWKGSSRSLFRTLVLENSKFLLFVLTPVFTASLFWNDSVVDYIVRSRQYVTYPPEGERPPTTREEVRARHAELRARLDAQAEAEGRRRGAGAAGAG